MRFETKIPKTLFKVGDWLKPRRKSYIFQNKAIVKEVTYDTVVIWKEWAHECDIFHYEYMRWNWMVMKPSYSSKNEKVPPWMVPGTRVTQHGNPSVWEIIEVRGVWMHVQVELGTTFSLCRAKESYKYTPMLNRYQRI